MHAAWHKNLKTLGTISSILCFLVPLASADVMDDIEDCDGCHGKDGVSTESDVPSIAGISPFIIEEYMFEYRDEGRICRESEYRTDTIDKPATDMCVVAKDLSEEEIPEIAEHYGSMDFTPAMQEFDAAKAAIGKKVHRKDCEKCHSDGGSYVDDDASILAGQWMPYLEQVFADYAAGDREMLDEKMKEKMDPLDAESLDALVHYYGSLQ